MEHGSNIDLSSNYKRAIGMTLTLLDKTICVFDEWAGGREHCSVLYAESNRLTPVQREAILAGTANIRTILKELRDTLGLDITVQSAAGYLWSQCSGLWANLTEIESKRLKGYGDAPQGFAEFFDPKLSEIERRLKDILSILKDR
jgi:hypothetical protein